MGDLAQTFQMMYSTRAMYGVRKDLLLRRRRNAVSNRITNLMEITNASNGRVYPVPRCMRRAQTAPKGFEYTDALGDQIQTLKFQ